ncbi:MAG TPA: hypothetical protein VMZ30_13300, partial [Pyrinomonadaceae bacterium]|nr:hypothetical protein [Pyrinomonadaceae bacterium]
MPNQINSFGSDSRPKPLSYDAVWDRVDPLAADCGSNPADTGLAKLPYGTLGGPGFERLVYELLQAGNKRPWFFGRTGQADYGVDIVTEATGRQTIYQCKNYAEAPSFSDVRKAVTKFESEWLSGMNLPAPEAFVYCCPHLLDDRSFDVEWERFRDAFQKRTGVALSFLDRHELDSKLRRLPDLVAGLFSDSSAEHFCGHDDWRDDPWVRLQRGPARFLGINRFLERHDRSAIYVAESHEQLFLAALDQGSTVALRGLPGMGKSFLALELACRMRQPLRRIYYATFKDGVSAERLWQSVRRRLSLPALFTLDDCHLAPGATEILLERLGPELRNSKLKLVLILRDQVGEAADRLDDTPAWLVRLKEERAIIDLPADVTRTLAVTCHLRPNFTGLSRSRLERLHNICGGDLLLLDEILQTVTLPKDIDTLEVVEVLGKVRTHYFGGNRRLPTLAKLAAIAQFDLLPRADFFYGEWRPGEEESADPLMTRLFAPPRFQFLHSSLAALVLRALAQLDVADDALDDMAASITTATLRDYLLYLSTTADTGEFAAAIEQSLRGNLYFWGDDLNEARIRSEVLGDEAIKAAIESRLARQSFANLELCVWWLSAVDHPAKAFYIELIERRFRILFEQTHSCGDTMAIDDIGAGLSALRNHATDRWASVLNEYGYEPFLRLIRANGTVVELFMVLKNATSGFRTALLEQLTAEQAEALIDKTIATGRSIGTLNLATRELGETDPDLLIRLENVIGAPGFLRLIHANGTVFELFMVVKHATPRFRTALLEQLTAEQAEALIDKTIGTGRSIGTLHLAMRELGET